MIDTSSHQSSPSISADLNVALAQIFFGMRLPWVVVFVTALGSVKEEVAVSFGQVGVRVSVGHGLQACTS